MGKFSRAHGYEMFWGMRTFADNLNNCINLGSVLKYNSVKRTFNQSIFDLWSCANLISSKRLRSFRLKNVLIIFNYFYFHIKWS